MKQVKYGNGILVVVFVIIGSLAFMSSTIPEAKNGVNKKNESIHSEPLIEEEKNINVESSIRELNKEEFEERKKSNLNKQNGYGGQEGQASRKEEK